MSHPAEFLRALRDAVRILLKRPVADAIALLALTLGIGGNVSSLIPVNSLLRRPFPYPDIHRLLIAPARALAEARNIRANPANRQPETDTGRVMDVVSLGDYFRKGGKTTGPMVPVLLCAAAFVWLFAGTDVGSPQLSKTIARQLLAENFLIALCSGVLGLMLASGTTSWSVAPPSHLSIGRVLCLHIRRTCSMYERSPRVPLLRTDRCPRPATKIAPIAALREE